MIHLDLRPKTEAQLAAEAEAHGLSLDRSIETLVFTRSAEPFKSEYPAEAIAAIRELRNGNRLDGLSIKELICDGRKR